MENTSELVLAWQQSQPDPRTLGTPAPAAGPHQPRRGGTATAPPPTTNPSLLSSTRIRTRRIVKTRAPTRGQSSNHAVRPLDPNHGNNDDRPSNAGPPERRDDGLPPRCCVGEDRCAGERGELAEDASRGREGPGGRATREVDQAEKLLTATAAAERQQRSQIASLTRMLEQLLKAQSDLGTDMQEAILDLLAGNTGSSATSLIGTLLVGSRMLNEQTDPPTEPARLALQP